MNDDHRKLRILFVNENLGGHATMHQALRGALAGRDDVDAEFIDAAPAGFLRRVAAAPLPVLGRADLDLQPLRAQLLGSAHLRRRLAARVNTADVVHVYTQNAALVSAGLLARRPLVVSTDATGAQGARLLPYRRPAPGTAARAWLHHRLEQRVFDAATFVIAKSCWAARSLRNDYGVTDGRLLVIRFGITIPAPPGPDRTDPPVPEITFVGATMARKGGDQLLRVFRRGLAKVARLNLVTWEPVRPEPGVAVFSDFEPGDPRLDALLARTAVFALPSEIDTFGYALIEAMARGIPVITTRENALPEVVDDQVSGLLVDVGDDAQLEAALVRLLHDGALRRHLGAAAQVRARERFDARATTARLLDVLTAAQARAE